MTKLLVSVRSAEEAGLAIAGGADLIDVKEPLEGSLGAASPTVIDEVLDRVGGRGPVSVACGELLQLAIEVARRLPRRDERQLQRRGTPGSTWPHASPLSQPLPSRGEELRNACATSPRNAGAASPWEALAAASAARESSPDFVKAGLAGCGQIDDWRGRWREFLAAIPAESAAVAVIYADWRAAEAPPPEAVLMEARGLESAAVLIDTFDKTGPGLLRLWRRDEIRSLIDQAHDAGMIIAVGGQLTMEDTRIIAALRPDYVAVRGAVCKPDRDGDLDSVQLSRLKLTLNETIGATSRGVPLADVAGA
jgi:uncharacterized protein (UPF0264 family)